MTANSTNFGTILIVEDELVFAKAVQKFLLRAGFATDVVGNLADAQDALVKNSPDVVLLDMRLPDGSGLSLLEQLHKNDKLSSLPVVVMSAYGELEDAVSAMKLGAMDYLRKPIDMDELLLHIKKVMQRAYPARPRESVKKHSQAPAKVEFLGESEALKPVYAMVERISQFSQLATTAPPNILILGETGTGKDVLARLLHYKSIRSSKAFVHLDCAALPRDLIEAELFGHKKGAFTGAEQTRPGLIEIAEDGILFLDEIGELPLELQAKLLAVLERRSLRRIGDTQERQVNAWFISATNRNLQELVKAKKFRDDLYYRLNVLSINVPPLRDRGEDILLLAKHFIQKTVASYALPGKVFLPDELLERLLTYRWEGNVRELKHTMERAVLLAGGGSINEEVLQLAMTYVSAETASEGSMDAADGKSDPVHADSNQDTIQDSPQKSANSEEDHAILDFDASEKNNIIKALEVAEGNVSKAARVLNISRAKLRTRMKKHSLQ